jgi:hypothetical protein
MSKAGYTAEVGAAVALAAATAKTVLSVIAPAQFGVDLLKYRIGFDGVTASAVPVVVELVTWTTDGTGTSGTVVQVYGRSITAGFTTKYNYTVEPTTPTLVDRFTLTPNGGARHLRLPARHDPGHGRVEPDRHPLHRARRRQRERHHVVRALLT